MEIAQTFPNIGICKISQGKGEFKYQAYGVYHLPPQKHIHKTRFMVTKYIYLKYFITFLKKT